MSDELTQPHSDVATVTVRYWASARAAAGVESERVEAHTLADVLAEVGRRHRDRDRFADVIGTCAILIGETPVGARPPISVPVTDGDSIEFLPPFAGG